jgi:hypothetical protein
MSSFPFQFNLHCLFTLLLACAPALAWGEAIEGEAVEVGRDALAGRTGYPWYDRKTDSVRPLRVAPERTTDSANRQSKWKKQGATNSPRTVTASGSAGSLFGPLFQVAGLGLLVALLLLIAYLVARAFMGQEVTSTAASRVIESSREADRVEDLPFAVKRPGGDLLAEARHAYEAGNYSEAIVYLYSYYLIQLDRQHLIRLAKGKTNRQYLREVRAQLTLRGILETTMIAFEDVFFGHHELPKERFEACWHKLDEFQREIKQTEELAA